MKYQTPNCPECGERAHECVDTLMAHTPISYDEDGNVEYGVYRVIGETQAAETDENGDELIRCPNGHEWASAVDP